MFSFPFLQIHDDDEEVVDEKDDVLNGEVPLYESSKSIEESDLVIAAKKVKKPRQKKNWQMKCQYDNSELAKSALQKEETWSVWKRDDTADGMKWFYRCNKIKLRDTQCAAQVYHLFKNDSDAVLEFRTDGAHDHQSRIDAADVKKRLIEEVEKLLKLHQKPNDIMHSLSEMEGITLPTKRQLINIIAKLRNQKYGPPSISMQQLTTWLRDHSSIPEDDHESFVLCFDVNTEIDEPYFRFMITTKYLLNLAKYRTVSHADTTYKCIWQGFPVFMVGTTDLGKEYHAYALAVCSNEKTADFHFVFEGIKEGLRRVFNYEMVQTTLVSDAAFAIINAFIEVFGLDVTIVMCWFHAKTAMEYHLTLVKKKENKVAILADIEFLHLAANQEIFLNAVTLFFNKWENKEDEFCKYFRSEWIDKHPNWYLGAAKFTPCHNNALEASNRYLKVSQSVILLKLYFHFIQ